MAAKELKINAEFDLTYIGEEGIEAIKAILLKVIKQINEES